MWYIKYHTFFRCLFYRLSSCQEGVTLGLCVWVYRILGKGRQQSFSLPVIGGIDYGINSKNHIRSGFIPNLKALHQSQALTSVWYIKYFSNHLLKSSRFSRKLLERNHKSHSYAYMVFRAKHFQTDKKIFFRVLTASLVSCQAGILFSYIL